MKKVLIALMTGILCFGFMVCSATNTLAWAEEAVSEDGQPSFAQMKAAYDQEQTIQGKISQLERIGYRAQWQVNGLDKGQVMEWLTGVAGLEKQAALRQAALFQLYLNGKKEALSRLVQDIDKNGLGQAEHYQGLVLDWQTLQKIANTYPQSYLARGIAAYEAVRGISYFAIERGEDGSPAFYDNEYGDQQYNPEKEIPGWEHFLASFSAHPAADDAAYRLARCYEIKGRWADALQTLLKAQNLPDGDMLSHIAGRIVYIQDVRMNGSEIDEILQQDLDADLKLMLIYSMTVKMIRMEDYERAAEQLDNVVQYLREHNIEDASFSPIIATTGDWAEPYDLKAALEQQQKEVQTLASFKASWEKNRNPQDLYALAAANYHNQMLYYNHLWAGQRQDYNVWNYIVPFWEEEQGPGELPLYMSELMNYTHSADMFQEVYEAAKSPQELKEKALFSWGLSCLGIYNWGTDAAVAYHPEDMQKQIINIFEEFLRQYPKSSMADEALLALADITGEQNYLDQLFTMYPQSDSVEKAQQLQRERFLDS